MAVSYSKPALSEIILVETVLVADPLCYEIMSEANNIKDGSFGALEKYSYHYLVPRYIKKYIQKGFQPNVAD